MKDLPLVAIVGRPNVGKSTLFNRIIGHREALVHESPGMTRDRKYGRAEYAGKPFLVIDTGGYEEQTDSQILARMREQTMNAIEEADSILLVMDGREPAHPVDHELVRILRENNRAFTLVVNKCENENLVAQAYADFSGYGLPQVYPVSAMHGEGMFDLLDEVTKDFATGEEEYDPTRLSVAIVGRVNVGKSTLINRLLGEERVIASPVPGTTRDSIDTEITVNGQQFTLIDTAGIRRRSRIERGAEALSVHASLRAIERAEVCLLLMDATEGVTDQDQHIAGYIQERKRACILVVNKWDAIEKDNETHGAYIKMLRKEFGFLKWAPILTISGKTGQRASKLWALIRMCSAQFRREFSTRELNLVLKKALAFVSPPTRKSQPFSIKYVTQTGYRPPELTLFVNDPKLCHFSYFRYLENQFRMQLDMQGSPIILTLKRKAPPRGWERNLEFAGQEQLKRDRRMLQLEEDYVAASFDEDDGVQFEYVFENEDEDDET
ncbi:MAG: ribosome biogenesis GTPase Der [Candidatus Sumerlaeia bacterium]|nr:ribosome biogenesis GTPase Der [Candidatus Sumerlaeia bacterium]